MVPVKTQSIKFLKAIPFLFLGLLSSFLAYSQGCNIEISIRTKEASKGKSNGEVIFEFNNSEDSNRYLLFNVTAARTGDKSGVQLKTFSALGLSKGIYEFLVVDKNRKECFKEIVADIKESK